MLFFLSRNSGTIKKIQLSTFNIQALFTMNSEKTGISVTVLGSGTCVPSLTRNPCSVLMETKGENLVFDCGPGIMGRLLQADTTIFEVSFIFLSHFHPDHSGELASFLFANKYCDGSFRKNPLTIAGGKGFSDFYCNLKNVYGHWIELPPGLLNIIELDSRDLNIQEFENFTVTSVPTEHNKESIAYRITASDGTSVVYSGDTDFSEKLISLAEDADLLICESAFPDELKVKGHLTPSLAGEIAAKANVRKLVLTHFYPVCDNADIEKQCRKTYSGPLVLAEDLMKIKVSGEN